MKTIITDKQGNKVVFDNITTQQITDYLEMGYKVSYQLWKINKIDTK